MISPLDLSPLSRALLSLEGLSVGDAYGETFFSHPPAARATSTLPPAPWPLTDDTLMAIDLVETLTAHGTIVPAALARRFLHSFNPTRGYGPAMESLFDQLRPSEGENWQTASRALFGGRGSFGNGSAMRVAPLGAYFASNTPALLGAAAASAVATHAHPEAAAGAIAVALAAALAVETGADPVPPSPQTFVAAVRDSTPPGQVRAGLDRALALPADATPQEAAAQLGNGSHMSCPDTVPFALWSAGTSLASYEAALTRTASAGGDTDTTCAIVGGIVVLRSGLTGIPSAWRERREPLAPLLTPSLRDGLTALPRQPPASPR